MCKINIIVKQSQSQKKKRSNETMIFYSYSHKSECVLFYTHKNIPIKYWDKKSRCVKQGYPGSVRFNMYLSKFKQKLEDIINTALTEEKDPTTSYVKDRYDEKVKDTQTRKSLSFWEFVDEYMQNAKIRLTSNTIRSYKTTIKNIKSYEKYARIKIDWDNIDLTFYHNYMEYYTGYHGLKISGFGKVIKILKSILNSATEQGHNTSLIYKSRTFKALSEKSDNIYLNEDELSRILQLDLVKQKTLERVRDLFYIGCYTGLRFSDYSQISSENIKRGNLHVKTQKTGALVVIPLMDEAKSIIDKYEGVLPKPMTNQVMNRYLKQIGKMAKIDGIFHTYHTTGEGRKKQSHKKWQMISTHTARRSFATNMYKRRLDPMMIMQITGHSSEKVFMDYIKISKEENAKRFMESINNKNAA